MLPVGGDRVGQGSRAAGRDGLGHDLERQAFIHVLESDLDRVLAHVGDFDLPAFLLALEDVAGPDLRIAHTQVAEMDGIHLPDGEGLLVDDAPQVEDDGLLDVRYIDGQGLVEGEGAVFVLVGRGDGAFASRPEALPGPFDVGAAAGGQHVQDGDGLVRDILDVVGAADGALAGLDVAEIIDGTVQLHAAAEAVLRGRKDSGHQQECEAQKGVCLHPFHRQRKGNDNLPIARMGPE